MMNVAYSSKVCKYPLDDLCAHLPHLSDQDVTSLLSKHHVETDGRFVKFSKTNWKSWITSFTYVSFLFHNELSVPIYNFL